MIRVGLFFEDEGHRALIAPLCERLARLEEADISVELRNASGGEARALRNLRQYAIDLGRGTDRFLDVLVVALDGNCNSHHQRAGQIKQILRDGGYAGQLVVAVPDPHIERWFLADIDALSTAVGAALSAQLPGEKCERGFYKDILREAIRSGGVDPPLGGIEFGEDIAMEMDLGSFDRVPSLQKFARSFRAALRVVLAGRPP